MCHSCTQSLCSAFFFLLLSSHLRFSRLLLVIDNISFAVAPAVCSGKVFSLSSLLSYQLPFSESRGRDNKGPLFLSLASYFPFRQHTFSVHYLRTSLYLSVPLCTSGRDTIAHTRCPGVSVLLQSRVMTQFFSPLPLATFSPLQLHSTPAQRTWTAQLHVINTPVRLTSWGSNLNPLGGGGPSSFRSFPSELSIVWLITLLGIPIC